MAIFNEETKKQLTELIGELKNVVNIAFFGSEINCWSCKDTMHYMEAFCQLNEKIQFHYYDMAKEESFANQLSISKLPGIAILDDAGEDFGIRFYGIPAGYEVHSLISAIREVSGIPAELPAEISNRIRNIQAPVHLQVFVTPSCSQCPGAAITAHRLAMLNNKVTVDVIEANTFSELSRKYAVKSVPKTIINEIQALSGSHPITKLLDVIESTQPSMQG